MYKVFLFTLLTILFQEGASTVSPDGNFSVTIKIKDESDLQKRYITTLTNNVSKETIEIGNCIRRDLSAPNFYWDKNSEFLIVERCAESFKDSRIIILNLKTRKADFELTGLIGNKDNSQQQFDSTNSIVLYFDTSILDNDRIPSLYTFDLTTKKKKLLMKFTSTMDMEFPEIKRVKGKRQIKKLHK